MDADTAGFALHDLPRAIGDDLLAVAVPAPDDSARIHSVGVLDGHTVDHCDLVLAIGTAWPDVVTLSAARGASAVVVDSCHEDVLPDLRAQAVEAGICLLQRNADVPWLTLADLIRDLIRHAEAEGIRGSGVALDDLAGLAESLAQMLGGPVIIEDNKFRLLSYSSSSHQVDPGRDAAILGRRIPDDWLSHLQSLGAIDTLVGSDQVVTVDDGPFHARRRLLCSIRAERFLLGILWVAEGDAPLPDDVRDRMTVAARTAAPFLLRYEEAGFRRRSAQDRQMRELLDRGDMSRPVAEEQGLSPAFGFTVVGLRLAPDAMLTDLDRNRLVESVGMFCLSYRRRAAGTTIGHTVYFVLAHGEDTDHSRIIEFASSMVEHVGRALLGRKVHIALSRGVNDLRDIPDARRQADQVLEIFAETTTSAVVTFDDAYPRIALSAVGRFIDQTRIAYPKLEVLRACDRSGGSDYTTTLAAYLSAFGNVLAAAQSLNIHVTTLRYRLRRIAAISGLDLEDPAERLLCDLLLLPASRSPRSGC